VEPRQHSHVPPSFQLQSSEYVSGYLACLEDLAESTQPVYHHQISATGGSVSFRTPTDTRLSCSQAKNLRTLPITDEPTELVSLTQYDQFQRSKSNSILAHGQHPSIENSSANSIIEPVPRQNELSSTEEESNLNINSLDSNVQTQLRFVYYSIPNRSRDRLLAARPGFQQRAKESTAIAKRKIIRKKGPACALCGEQKVKASYSCPEITLALIVSSVMRNLSSRATDV